ncbi:ATP-binding protein [Magnetospirillum sp. SS-4]|uniref:ATP-binding protein n=1 Tax=Magnetospirillum sp. SS-4 TaxID=2681465 RepID=UPI00137F8D1F|nr:ATP-binding protein [Magnetospirillum sp. SS-4]CAA7622110.1 putative two-component sensor histidine-kinase (Modular protein), classical system [Magnetospirillum sp. SS-4]
MRRLIPDSIAGRTLLVLLVGLTLSHMASTAILSSDRHDAIATTSDSLTADRVGAFARLLDQAPAVERDRLARSLGSPLLTVSLGDSPAMSATHRDEVEVVPVRQSLESHFGSLDHDRLHVTRQRHGHADGASFWWRLLNGFPDEDALLVAVRLTDGAWATFDLTMPGPPTLWAPHSILSALVMIAAILVLGGWAAGWVSAPLATFARAADRLGRDVHAAPLSERGPREVRQAVAAFNEMQGRIRRFVDDRTRMLAAISHDLRSPITRLRLRAEMLPATESSQRMLADLAEMEAMVTSTLEFARGEAGDEESAAIDLAATLEAVCDNATDMGLPAQFDWSGRLVCTCRPLAIKRALANLVENAARYGGRAVVHARHAGRDVVVTIDDDGPGIPEAEMEKVFAPFYRIEGSRNRKTGGIGLGLTVVRTIIRAHGGDIRLENRKEGGLRVTVTIPQGEEA